MVSEIGLVVAGTVCVLLALLGRERLLGRGEAAKGKAAAWLFENGYLSVLPELAWRLVNALLGIALIAVGLTR